VIICTACGRENSPDSSFCSGCGASLVVVGAPREQRKTVTVLFCDVTGSTAMGERLDPESLRRVMRRYFDAARRVIEHHGGTVEKFIGDAVMAVFGLPVLHEDDALRAVRAAAELRDALGTLNQELERDYATTVIVRTGVNTGEVVTGTDERLATGDAINVAARLEQAAAPGEIVIGPETRSLLRDAVSVEPFGPLELRGKSTPITAYRLLQVHGEASATTRGADVPLVGRVSQLRMLTDAFQHAVRERSCSLFTVLGSAGVGKSRIAAEFLRHVDATVLRGRCLSYGDGITYWPVVSMLKQLFESDEGSAATELMAHDERVAAAIHALLGDQTLATSPTEIAWAVRKVLESSAQRTPVVVVFEDLHWGETTLFDLIEHMADFSRDAAILILCVGRAELLDRRPGWGGGKFNATTMLLEPLNAEETEALIDELLPADGTIDAQLRTRVRATAAGNPLFVEEMLAMVSAASSAEVAVPPTIQALLAARLDQLRPDERSVLERGSVEGQSFHRGAVQVMSPEDQDVSGRLMTLVRKDLVRPDRPVFTGEDAFKFRHILIRDAAYDSLSKAERAELHERFAGWLLQRATDLVELDEIAGHHLEQAYRYRAELGAVDEEGRRLAADAARHLEAAGSRALSRGDTAAAVNLLERADSLRPVKTPDLALEEGLMGGLAISGRFADAISRAQKVADLCSAAGDEVGAMHARLAENHWRWFAGKGGSLQDLSALVDEARPVIERSGDAAALAYLEHTASLVEFVRQQFGAALAALTRAMGYAKRTGKPWLIDPLRSISAASVRYGPTRIDEALRWFDVAQAESSKYEPMIDTFRADLLACTGHFEEARSILANAFHQLSERGELIMAAATMQAAFYVEMVAGDAVAAERAARRGCEELEKVGERSWLSTQQCQLGEALYALGRYDEAERWALRGVEVGDPDDTATQMLALQVRAKVLARRGEHDAALALAQEADALAGATDAPTFQGDAVLALAEVLLLAGDQVRAEKEVRRAIECYERKGATACVARARMLITS